MGEAENVRERLAALLPPDLSTGWLQCVPIVAAAALADRLERAADVERDRDELRAAVERVREMHSPTEDHDDGQMWWNGPGKCRTLRALYGTEDKP